LEKSKKLNHNVSAVITNGLKLTLQYSYLPDRKGPEQTIVLFSDGIKMFIDSWKPLSEALFARTEFRLMLETNHHIEHNVVDYVELLTTPNNRCSLVLFTSTRLILADLDNKTSSSSSTVCSRSYYNNNKTRLPSQWIALDATSLLILKQFVTKNGQDSLTNCQQTADDEMSALFKSLIRTPIEELYPIEYIAPSLVDDDGSDLFALKRQKLQALCSGSPLEESSSINIENESVIAAGDATVLTIPQQQEEALAPCTNNLFNVLPVNTSPLPTAVTETELVSFFLRYHFISCDYYWYMLACSNSMNEKL